MGKKLSQASLKISKNDKKKQLNSLIKVLRPKVYITDTSSFKKLVQELTGNGTTISSSPPPTTPQMVEKVPIVDIEDHGELDSSVEALSFDASINDSFEICNQEYCYPEELQQEYNQMYWDDITSDISLMNQPVDLLAHQELESWLLDIDQPYPFLCGYSEIQQEVSIYDYELSGLI